MTDALLSKKAKTPSQRPTPEHDLPDWLLQERQELADKLDVLNEQIASIPPDSSLKGLRAMMVETAKGLERDLDELDEFVPVRPATHKLLFSKKD